MLEKDVKIKSKRLVMNWWKNVFNPHKIHQKLRTIGQINATHIAKNSELPVIAAPVTGQLQQNIDDYEPVRGKNGFMMTPNGNSIVSPVAGIVVESDQQILVIQSVHHDTISIYLKTDDFTKSHLAIYNVGQQLHAGDLVGITRGDNQKNSIYIILDRNKVYQFKTGSVYAGQNILQQSSDEDDNVATERTN